MTIMNFTSVVDATFTTLTITDSTVYIGSDAPFTNRTIIVTKSDGSSTTTLFPWVLGTTDKINISTTKDEALSIRLQISANAFIKFKVMHLLLANRLILALNEKRRLHILLNFCDRDTLAHIQNINSYLQAAKYLISSNLAGAQKALDAGNILGSIKINV